MQSVQALTGHADGAGIDVVSGEFVGTHPTDRFRLVVVLWYGAVRSDDEKPNVEMEVRSVCGRIDLVDVDVDRDRVDPQALDARLLGRLAQRDRGQVGVTVAVSARLQPALQLGVEQQEDVLGRGIDDQRGAGQMALEAAAVEGVVMGTDEVEDRATMAFGIGVDLGRDDGGDGIVQRGRRLQVGVSGIEHGPDPTSVRYETVSAAVPILGRHDAVGPVVDLDSERAALARSRAAVDDKLERLAGISGGGADELADEYIDAVVRGTVEKLQQELVVFGRIDDDHVWRVGLYGIDEGGEQLVVDWRAPFAGGFYQARFDEPMGLDRRVTYVGTITDLFVEDFSNGEISGTSPLLGELARSRGTEMRTAVATLQSEQDALVRLDPAARLVLRGGPGTGKTVVALHRAAWLVYNDNRLTAGNILVVGPSDKFLRFVSAVLPTLGEARITQTTFERLLGPSNPAGSDERWLEVLDRIEERLVSPAAIRVEGAPMSEDDIAALAGRILARGLPWRDKRKVFVEVLANRLQRKPAAIRAAIKDIWPAWTTTQLRKKLRNRAFLEAHGAPADLVDAWLAAEDDGALADEVRARVEGIPVTYGHVIVDEAQDLTLLQLRAIERRSDGVTFVGDDAQRSNPLGLGLRTIADRVGVTPEVMATAYRMSAEIADWLNEHAEVAGIDAVRLVGIRPTGVAVRDFSSADADPETLARELGSRHENVAVITVDDTWVHKGVEYDAVVVDTTGMSPSEIYLAASRAAHELVVLR